MTPVSHSSLDALPCGFLQLDAADRVVLWNRRLETWTGLARADVVGRPLVELFPRAPALPRVLAEVRASGQPRVLAQMFHHWLIPIPLTDGAPGGLTEMQQECHLVPLAEPAGHLALSLLDVTPLVAGHQRAQALVAERTAALARAEQAVRDLTARETALRESEALLREHKDRLDLALEAANTCTWDNDMVHNILKLDEHWMALLGGKPEPVELPGHQLLRRVHPDDRAATVRHIRDCYERNADQYRVEHRVRTLAGQWIWVLSSGRVVARDPAGRAARIIGTNTDITAIKHAEAELQRQKEFLSTLQHTTLDLLARRELRDVFQTLVERASAILQAPFGELMLKEGDHLVVSAFTRNQPYTTGPRLARGEAALSWHAHDTGLPAVTPDYATHEHRQPRYASLPVHAVAEFPIMLGRTCVGVLAVARHQPGHVFTAEDFQKGSLLAHMAALVLHNANVRDAALREAAERTAALRESEQKFRGVFDQSPIIVSLVSIPDGRIVEANSAGLAAFGYTREEMLGRTTAELGLWADPADRDRYLQRLTAENSVRDFEARMRRRNGEIFTVLYNGCVVNIAGRPYSLNSMQDITARKQSEAARDQSLAAMRATLESTADGILVVDAGDRVETWNRMFASMWGLADDVLATGDNRRAIAAILDKLVDPTTFLARIDEILADPAAHSSDLLPLKDGRIIERHSRPQLVHGRPVGRVWSFRDITERQRAEAALRESEERFRVLAEVSPVGIFSSDTEGRCTFVNRRWCEIAGLRPDEAHGDAWMAAIHPDDRAAVTAGWTEAVRTGGSSSAEYRFLRPDGTVTWLVGESLPQRDATGAITGYVGTITDVTHLKRAEQERERMENQMRETQRLESLGTLAGGIAHDFNNILTGMFGFVELARLDLPDTHPARAWLDHVTVSGQRAKELVRQILTFSRKHEGERRPEQLETVVAEALRLLRSTLPAMVVLDHRGVIPCPPVLADATQIHQVVMNLCTNAWHALPERGGRITVALEPFIVTDRHVETVRDLLPGPHVRLTVADTGSGMTPDTIARVFEPFFTTKAPGKGTGLGLAVVHGIVKSHGGAIAVRSTPGTGTTFELYFPALVALAPQPPEKPEVPLPRGHGERILLVDDDNVSGFAIQKLIESLGYRVTRFTAPLEAIAHFRSAPLSYDVVVTDLAMPAMPGDAVAEELLRIRSSIPVLLVTGFLEPARQPALDQIGIAAILRKPPSRDELAAALARHAPLRLPGA